MNNQVSSRNSREVKAEMDGLLSFTEEELVQGSYSEAESEAAEKLELLSKYTKVLWCSFVDRTSDSA